MLARLLGRWFLWRAERIRRNADARFVARGLGPGFIESANEHYFDRRMADLYEQTGKRLVG